MDGGKEGEGGAPPPVGKLQLPNSPSEDESETRNRRNSCEQLTLLATGLTSPRPRRKVTFDHRFLPPECPIDEMQEASIYHNGKVLNLVKTRPKPGQKGYQILTPSPRQRLHISEEQAFRVVVTAQGRTFSFTGAVLGKGELGSVERGIGHVVFLAPVDKEQITRLRMDLVLDPIKGHISAVLLSIGQRPNATALMRLQGLRDMAERNRFLWLWVLVAVYILFLMQPRVMDLVNKWILSGETELIHNAQDIVKHSKIIKAELGEVFFEEITALGLHVQFFSQERTTFMIPFVAGSKLPRTRTEEWELENTRRLDGKEDEISVVFGGAFCCGEMHVDAYRVGGGWHIGDVKVDLYRTKQNYVDSILEWLIDSLIALGKFGNMESAFTLSVERKHLRVNIEVGHDKDLDGDSDHGAHRIIAERAQLIEDRRVVGYIRPDDDDTN